MTLRVPDGAAARAVKRRVLSEPLYLSNKSLHLFIQTNLTMTEIEDVVRGTDAGNSPEARPPIVLALRDDVFDEIGYVQRTATRHEEEASRVFVPQSQATHCREARKECSAGGWLIEMTKFQNLKLLQ